MMVDIDGDKLLKELQNINDSIKELSDTINGLSYLRAMSVITAAGKKIDGYTPERIVKEGLQMFDKVSEILQKEIN